MAANAEHSWVNEWLLFNANWEIDQLLVCHAKNKLHFNDDDNNSNDDELY
jgi:hypothetical protein